MAGQYVISDSGALEWQENPRDKSPDEIDHCEVLGHTADDHAVPEPKHAEKKAATKK